jgi:hypothetical protein
MFNKIKPIEISYEINWADDRRAPKKLYLEFEDQPAKIIEYTCKMENININSIPNWESKTKQFQDKGMNAQEINPSTNANMGERINIKDIEFRGIIVSFKRSLTPSTIGCSTPPTPTWLGPFLFWIEASSFLSKRVKKATDTKTAMIKKRENHLTELFSRTPT